MNSIWQITLTIILVSAALTAAAMLIYRRFSKKKKDPCDSCSSDCSECPFNKEWMKEVTPKPGSEVNAKD